MLRVERKSYGSVVEAESWEERGQARDLGRKFVLLLDGTNFFFLQDYHVIFLYHPEPEKCLVYDLDSELPFPTYVHKYVTETFRTDHILKPDYFR